VDLVRPLSARYAREAVTRAPEAALRSQTVKVLAPEDFILFKVLSTRERDIEDAASALRRSGSILDMALITREVESLTKELPALDVKGRYARVQQASGKA
jgi:hypothetical protein